MSTESANEWILKLQGDEALRNEVDAAGFKARQAVAKEHGFEFTHDEIKNARAQTLSDADLDAVAGGSQVGTTTENSAVATGVTAGLAAATSAAA